MSKEEVVARELEKAAKMIDNSGLDILEEPEQFGDVISDEGGETPQDLTTEEVQELEKMKGEKLTPEEIEQAKAAKNAGEETGKETGKELEIPAEFENIDPSKLPPELKVHFNKMLNAYTQRMSKLADVEKKAQLFDYALQNPDFFRERITGQTPGQQVVTEDVQLKQAEDTLFKAFNVPEDHELAPAFRAMASLMIRNYAETKKTEANVTQTTFKTNIESFVNDRPGLREDREFLMKMDEIGKENPRLYNNLGRLYNFTKAELGRDHIKKDNGGNTKIDIAKLYRDMRTAKKSKTSKSSSAQSTVTVKKAKTVAEAFKQAEEMLSRK